MKKMDGGTMEPIEEPEKHIFYITFYDIDPKPLTTNQLRKEVLNTILKKFNQTINITLVTPFTKE